MPGTRVSPLGPLEDALDSLELTCKGFRVLSLLICECREDLQSHDREGISVLLDRLTGAAEECLELSWGVLRKEA